MVTENAKPKTGIVRGCLMVIGGIVALFIILGIIGMFVGGGKEPATAVSDAGPQEKPIEVTARQLSAAFQENEAKARIAYDKHPLLVSGTIKDIHMDISDSPVISLVGANDVENMGVNESGKITDVAISGLAKGDAAKLNKGASLTVLCAGSDVVMGGAQLSGCSIR